MNAVETWLPAVGVAIVAALVLLVPGLLATAPLRLPFVARLAVSGAFSVASIGLAGVLFALLGLPFALWQVLVIAAAGGVILWTVRRRRPSPSPSARWSLCGAGWFTASWLAAATVIAVVAFVAVPDPARISQTYDNVFHLSAIAQILETGDASSLTLRTLIEPARTWSFYPAGWHSIVALAVQLTGAPIAVAVNASWIAVAAVIWVPGAVWLAQVLLPGFDRGLVALVALPLATAFGAMPYTLLTWGTLYPTFLATALLPVAVAAPLSSRLLRRDPAAGRISSPAWISAVVTAVALAAVGVSQPRVLVTWGLLIAPFLIGAAVGVYLRARRAGGRARVVAGRALLVGIAATVVVAAAGFAYLVLRLGLFERPLDDRLGGPQARATQSVLDGLWQVLAQSWPTGAADGATFPAILLAVAVLGGIVVAARTRGMRWIVVSYAVVALLFAWAAGSDDVVAKLATALWYKDRFRLSSALPVLGVTLATLGVLASSRWVRARRLARGFSISLAWLVAVTAAAGLALGGLSSSAGFVFRLPERAAQSEVLSQAQADFLARVGEIVPAGQRLLGDPWDGSALSLVYAGREPVFPHVNGQWDPQRALIASSLPEIAVDPAVCAALDDLRVRYVFYNPHEFGGGDPAGNLFAGVHAAVEQGLFEEVATDGDSTLYRIPQCGPLPG